MQYESIELSGAGKLGNYPLAVNVCSGPGVPAALCVCTGKFRRTRLSARHVADHAEANVTPAAQHQCLSADFSFKVFV